MMGFGMAMWSGLLIICAVCGMYFLAIEKHKDDYDTYRFTVNSTEGKKGLSGLQGKED